jgi:NADH-quinone oxidoreductase subunit L
MNTLLWSIPLLPLAGSLVCGVLYALTLRARKAEPSADGFTQLAGFVAVGAMALSFVVGLLSFFELAGADAGVDALLSPAWDWIHAGRFDIELALVFDRLSGVMTLVVTGVGLLIHIYATGYMRGDPGYAKFFAYLNLFVAMMLILVLAGNMLGTFVGWEGVGLCSYLLIGFWYRKGWPAEAAQKAFVVNRIGDAAFLLGMFLLATTFGSLDYAAINDGVIGGWQAEGMAWKLGLAAILLFGGACGKSAQIPLFVWLPDAMAGPTPVSALIHAATMVTSGIYLVVRLNPLFAAAPWVLPVVGTVGVLTALLAGSSALRQRDLKGVLAYSTVSQLGYMFLALGAGAWVAAIFHLVTHAFFKALLFLGAGSVIHGMHDEQDMHRMGGLKRHLPKTYLAFLCGAGALSGLPLLSGFFSKDEILAHAFAQGSYWYVLWGLGIFTAALTAYYTWRMVALTFWGDERFDVEHVHPHESPRSMLMPLAILAGLSLAGGVLGLPAVFHLPHLLGTWLEPVVAGGNAILAAHHGGHLPHLSHAGEWLLLGLGSAVALLFAHKGFHAHRAGTGGDERFAEKRPDAARVLGDAWGVDRAYTTWIVQPLALFAYGVAVVIDQFGIDGAVNWLGRSARAAGTRLRRLTDGSIATYGLWMGGGAAGLALVWMWLGAA